MTEIDALLAGSGSGVAVARAGRKAGALAALASRMRVDRLIAAPLRYEGQLIGLLLAGSDGTPPDGDVQRVASEASRIASLAIGGARLRAEVARLERRRLEILSIVSHELRSPLHVVLGWENLLREGDLGELEPEQYDAVLRIGRNARQLADIVENTLGAGRLVASQLPVGIVEVDPHEVVTQVLYELSALYGDGAVRVVREVPDDLPFLLTDREKLKVVLRNLVANAVKFTDSGEVRIGARGQDDGVEFWVADTGVGIPPEKLGAIFDEFYHVPACDGRLRGGVGLGLYIVRSMLEKLGGTIAVESTVGRGSTFRVWVPRRLAIAAD
jgi:signal transduction histidine kinase